MLLSGILGTLTGIVSNAVGGWFKIKEKRLSIESQKIQNDHEIAMVKAETEATIEEAKANIKITQAQVEGEVELKNIDAFMEAQKQEGKNIFSNKWIDALMKVEGWWRLLTLPIASLIAFLFGFCDFLRKMVRPSLTIYLAGISTYITWMAWEIMKLNHITLSAAQATSIFLGTTEVILYLFVSAVTFYFGDRQMNKYIMETKGIDVKKMDDDIKI